MPVELKILYVGPLDRGSTCLQRMRSLQSLGHRVVPINTVTSAVRQRQRTLAYRLRRKLLGPGDLASANRQIVRQCQGRPFDILWIDKGLTITRETLEQVRRCQPDCRLVGYSPDDMFPAHNQSHQFLDHLPLYDIFFTTKSYGVEELEQMGCRCAVFVGNAYDPQTHRPVPVTAGDRSRLGGGVGFVGAYEAARAESMYAVAQRHTPVRIWGPGWNRCGLRHDRLLLERRSIWAEDYVTAVCCFDINLCFLRKINRDLQTTRSIEIPACGGFMLAERTEEHQGLFAEGEEAEFFGCDDELADKVRYYLAHGTERERIAAAGRRRCQSSGYSNQDRLRSMLDAVNSLLV